MSAPRRHQGHTLPELLVTSVIVLLLLGLVASVLTLATRSNARVDAGVDLQFQARAWLDRMASDLAGSSRHRLFPNRCELDVYRRSELFRFDPAKGYDPSAQEAVVAVSFPVGTPEKGWESPVEAFNFDRSEVLGVTAVDPRSVRLHFPTAPKAGDRILLEYPVNQLVTYWREPASGLLRREFRDSAGATTVEILNPAERRPRVQCQRLEFAEPIPQVIRLTVGVAGDGAATWQDALDVSLAR